MNFVHVVAVFAVLQFFLFGVLVGRARVMYGIRSPATSGHEYFERAFRVQMNTLEQLVGFLPALFLAAYYWPDMLVAGIGAIYLIGRFVYRRSFMADPSTRRVGFALTIFPTFILLGLSLAGALGLRAG